MTRIKLKRKCFAALPGFGFGSGAFKQMAKTNTFKQNAGLAFKGTMSALGSTALTVGTLGTAAALGTKAIASKASEQSDGSRVFSENRTMKTYTLKRKTYSDSDEKKGMSTGGKVALGLGATAATTALAFASARRGAFGSQTAMNANKLWASAGKKLGNQGMINSAANRFGEAMGTRKYDHMIANHKGEMTEAFKNNVNARVNASGEAGKRWILDRYKIPTTPKA